MASFLDATLLPHVVDEMREFPKRSGMRRPRFLFFTSILILLTMTLPVWSDETRWIREHVHFLTSLPAGRSHENLESLNKAAGYIEGKLKETTKDVAIQEFTVNGRKYKNILARYAGRHGAKKIVVGAHYDTAGPYPGADDNASGVAVLLELAFLLHDAGKFRTHNVELAFYSLEEPPYFRTDFMGSAYHARSLAEAKTSVDLMIALDAVGIYTEQPGSQKYPWSVMRWKYPDRGNFLAVVGKTGQGSLIERVHKVLSEESHLPMQSISAPSWLSGSDYSDHLNFWKHGYPAVLLTDTAFYRNPHYHTAADTAEKLDYNAMTEVVRALFHLLQRW